MDTASTLTLDRSPAWAHAHAMRADAAPPQRDTIEALGKGLRIIEAFNDERPRMGASEAALAAGVSRAAARRYLLSLCSFGYAETDGRLFWLAPRVLRLGQSFLTGGRLPRLVQPFLERLSIASGECASMSVLDDHEMVYLAASRGARLVAAGHAQGARLPAHVVAAGHAVLACRSRDAVADWALAHEFSAFTPHTVTCADAFCAQVDIARHLGHAWVEGQHHMALKGLAVALQDRRGHCIGALALTLQSASATRQQAVENYLPLLMDARESLRRIV